MQRPSYAEALARGGPLLPQKRSFLTMQTGDFSHAPAQTGARIAPEAVRQAVSSLTSLRATTERAIASHRPRAGSEGSESGSGGGHLSSLSRPATITPASAWRTPVPSSAAPWSFRSDSAGAETPTPSSGLLTLTSTGSAAAAAASPALPFSVASSSGGNSATSLLSLSTSAAAVRVQSAVSSTAATVAYASRMSSLDSEIEALQSTLGSLSLSSGAARAGHTGGRSAATSAHSVASDGSALVAARPPSGLASLRATGSVDAASMSAAAVPTTGTGSGTLLSLAHSVVSRVIASSGGAGSDGSSAAATAATVATATSAPATAADMALTQLLLRIAADSIVRDQVRLARFQTAPTAAEAAVAKEAMRLDVGSEHEVLFQSHSVDYTRKHMRVLRPRGWLTDEPINMYYNLLLDRNKRQLAQHAKSVAAGVPCAPPPKLAILNSFFYEKLTSDRFFEGVLVEKGYDYDRVKRWTRDIPDVFACDVLLIPINCGNTHWTSVHIQPKLRRIQYLDSLNGAGTAVCQALRRWLYDEHIDKKGTELPISEWQIVRQPARLPQQTNGVDCGAFVCLYAELLSQGIEPDEDVHFSQAELNDMRARIASNLMARWIP